ncbi:MAG: hypothetical protein N838_26785, partial [Thiohalocapsa sp. PB-PSB1]
MQESILSTNEPTQRLRGYAGTAPDGIGGLVQALATVSPEPQPRHPSGIDELDRVLGGGLVPGSIILIGGDPGIGKSTLLLQAGATLGERESVLYVTGEESPQQVSLRAHRLNLPGANIQLLAETCVEHV